MVIFFFNWCRQADFVAFGIRCATIYNYSKVVSLSINFRNLWKFLWVGGPLFGDLWTSWICPHSLNSVSFRRALTSLCLPKSLEDVSVSWMLYFQRCIDELRILTQFKSSVCELGTSFRRWQMSLGFPHSLKAVSVSYGDPQDPRGLILVQLVPTVCRLTEVPPLIGYELIINSLCSSDHCLC